MVWGELTLPSTVPRGAVRPNLTVSLLRRGFSEEQTSQILGGNFLRVFSEVWR